MVLNATLFRPSLLLTSPGFRPSNSPLTQSICNYGDKASSSTSNSVPASNAPHSASGPASNAPPPYVIKSVTDWIGPPDKSSHIRPVHFPQLEGESEKRKAYRESVEKAAKWNHDFWLRRNRDFFDERERFVRTSIQRTRIDLASKDAADGVTATKTARPTGGVSAEEMSDFYRRFLAENQEEQMRYLKGWHRLNFQVVKTGFLCFLSETFSKRSK